MTAIAQGSAAAGNVDEAERIARSALDPARELVGVAVAMTAAGRADDAARLADDALRIAKDSEQADPRLLTQIASVLVRTGRDAAARAVAMEAEAAARRSDGGRHRADGLAAVAAGLAGHGDAEGAARICALVRADRRGTALAATAVALAEVGLFDAGWQVAVEMADGPVGLGALVATVAAIAEARCLAGQVQPAQQAALVAERLARQSPDPHQRVGALLAISARRIDPDLAGRLIADAEAIARSITDDRMRADALAEVATGLAGGQPTRARTLAAEGERAARAIADDYWRDGALAKVAAAQATAGNQGDAVRIAGGLPDGYRRESALTEIAAAVARHDPDEAERIAAGIGGEYQTRSARIRVAVSLAEIGDDLRAERIAMTISDFRRARILAEVAFALAGAGRTAPALRLAGDAERAAREFGGVVETASVLTIVAKALLSAGDTPGAARLSAELLTSNEWAEALLPLVRVIDPPEQARLVERLVAWTEATRES